jgi:hypothetical protein
MSAAIQFRTFLPYCLLSENAQIKKKKQNKTTVLPVVVHGFEISSLTFLE